MSITFIACLDMASGIGDDSGNLLFNIPKDMKRFKALTRNKVVVMGRKTWDSLPNKPLKRRMNVVLTTDENFSSDGAYVINSIDEVLKLSKGREIYVIGGGEIYRQLMPYADKMLLTQVHDFNFNARIFFPEINVREWDIKSIRKHEEDKASNTPSFSFVEYIKSKNKSKSKAN